MPRMVCNQGTPAYIRALKIKDAAAREKQFNKLEFHAYKVPLPVLVRFANGLEKKVLASYRVEEPCKIMNAKDIIRLDNARQILWLRGERKLARKITPTVREALMHYSHHVFAGLPNQYRNRGYDGIPLLENDYELRSLYKKHNIRERMQKGWETE